ncbi:uncharacterized protein LOC655784 [Tribolium castaneum]|uniref:uncharacterized protein LOC655784 n=1 Tax=Tribolium castaneum TaxID=7070 RepID=UPI0030FDF731
MDSPVVVLKEGRVKGSIGRDYFNNPYYYFLGIPYGKAPIGELRFKAPVPVEPWKGTKDATQEGPVCSSRHVMFKRYVGAEDNCLHVNVYTPQLPSDGNNNLKPVMVWIHGGGFLYDSNRREMYGPEYLITEDVVIVSVNYRLGVFGFLSLENPALEVPGNAGMKDMVLALKWVQNNITSFSGDPNNVTVFGESAGSAAVHYLYLSPKTKGLFHRAICQSGCALNSWAIGCTNGTIIADYLNFTERDEGKILEYLKSLPPQRIVKALHRYDDTFIASRIRPFGPVVEKYATESAFLTQEPLQIIKSGTFNKVPLIIGNNSREGILAEVARKVFGENVIGTSFEDEIYFYLKLERGSGESKQIAQKIKDFYFNGEDRSEHNNEKFYLLKTDNMFLHGTYKTVNYQKQATDAPIYFYEMTLDHPFSLFKSMCTPRFFYPTMFFYFLAYNVGPGRLNQIFLRLANLMPRKTLVGASHADDLSYIFRPILGEKVRSGSEEEIYMRRFIRLWANFARTGNPTPGTSDPLLNGVEWKPVTKDQNCILDIGTRLEMKNYPHVERMQFWDSIYSSPIISDSVMPVSVITIALTFGLNVWHSFIMSDPTVTIQQGQLRGKISTNIDNKNFYSFQGIPYAKPPTGPLRFKDPQAPEPWTGVKDATTEGSVCYAKHMLFNNIIGSEDCLHLNVYTPELASKNLRPVMVWIHGGAFKSGSSNTDVYGPEYLLTQDVVVVTFNYRLGIFGFLKLDDATLGVPGNAGMKDMVMALKWVRKNISKFGGDPNNVTIFGESAGAASVHYLVLSPLAKGLFHRAIAQSGTALNSFARGRSDMVSHISAELNTKNEREILEKLVQMPAEQLFELYEKLVTVCEGLNNAGGKLPFAPVIEKASQNAFIAEEPLKIIKSGNYNQVPLIFGFTTREGMLIEQMIKPRKPTMPRDFEAAIPYTLEVERGSENSKQIAQKIKDFYYGEPGSEDKLENFYIIHTDNYFLRDIIFAVKHHAATSKFPVYLYQMSVDSSLNVMKRLSNITAPGVAHGDDIGYLFKTKVSPALNPGSLEEVSVRRFVRLWTNFARNGNPDEPQWKPVKTNELNYIDIGEKLSAKVNPEPERMKFWEELYKNKPLYSI